MYLFSLYFRIIIISDIKDGGANETVIHHVPQMYKWDYKRENKKSQHM